MSGEKKQINCIIVLPKFEYRELVFKKGMTAI